MSTDVMVRVERPPRAAAKCSGSSGAMNEPAREPRSAAPEPISTGTDSYYMDRAADFRRRNPSGSPPSYYADYGDKCLHQFRAAKADLSGAGQAWLETTLRLLQDRIETQLGVDPEAFAGLELDGTAFQEFAFSTHADVYIEAGLFTLPADDLWRILRTPDAPDLFSPDGISEIVELLKRLDRDDIDHITNSTQQVNDQPHGFGRSIVVGIGIHLGRLFRRPHRAPR